MGREGDWAEEEEEGEEDEEEEEEGRRRGRRGNAQGENISPHNKTNVFMEYLPHAPLCYEHVQESMYVHLHFYKFLTITTTCDFERDGAKKLMIGSS